jgi:hypothetical protein
MCIKEGGGMVEIISSLVLVVLLWALTVVLVPTKNL